MREIEDSDIHHRRVGIFYKPYLQPAIDAGRRFMRQGSVAAAPQSSAQISEPADAVFTPLLADLGYAS